MIQEEVLSTQGVRAFSGKYSGEETRQIRIFVPVDFSNSAYNALEYALKLAQACHGNIDLFHVTDANELPESDNGVVMQRMLARLEKKIAAQVESLREMIGESGVTVASCESAIGNVRSALMRRIEQVSPDLVIIGRNKLAEQTISFMIRNVHTPVLVVPDTARPKVPSCVVLSSDLKPVEEKSLLPLFRIMQDTTQQLSVLNVCSKQNGSFPEFKVPVNGYGFRVNYEQQEDAQVLNGIAAFVRSKQVDLLCTVHRNRFSLKKLFRRSISSALASQLDIPVLLLRENIAS